MADMRYTFDVRTDENGYFSITKRIDPAPRVDLGSSVFRLSCGWSAREVTTPETQ